MTKFFFADRKKIHQAILLTLPHLVDFEVFGQSFIGWAVSF